MCLFRWPILSLSHTHAPPNICRTCRTSIICCNVKMLYRSNLTAIHLYFFSAAVLSIMMEPFSLTSIYLRYVVAVASVYSISIKTAFLVTKCYRIEQGMRELACNDNPICVRPTLTNRAEKNAADAIAEKWKYVIWKNAKHTSQACDLRQRCEAIGVRKRDKYQFDLIHLLRRRKEKLIFAGSRWQ